MGIGCTKWPSVGVRQYPLSLIPPQKHKISIFSLFLDQYKHKLACFKGLPIADKIIDRHWWHKVAIRGGSPVPPKPHTTPKNIKYPYFHYFSANISTNKLVLKVFQF